MNGQEMDPKLMVEIEGEVMRQIKFWRRKDVIEAVGSVTAQNIRVALNQGTDSIRRRAALSRAVVRTDESGRPTRTVLDLLGREHPTT